MTSADQPRGKLALLTTGMPADTNVNGDIFGGWLVSHMDIAGGMESRRRAKSRTVTVAINEMTFIKPVNVGDAVSCYIDLIKVGRTSMTFHIEVWTTSPIKDSSLQKVAQGQFTFVAIDDAGNPRLVDR